MKLDRGIVMLELAAEVMGKTETVYPTLIESEAGSALIDAGYPGQAERIRSEAALHGVALERLTAVLITHQDIDHIGSLQEIVRQADAPPAVISSRFERPYIQGDERPIRLTSKAVEQALLALPPDVPEEWRRAFRHTLENPPSCAVTATVSHGQTLPYGGGLVVIETPGHTPGHLSFYHPPSKTLIAGDALTTVGGQLHGADPITTMDPAAANRSIAEFLRYDISQVVCYHGGLFRGDPRQRLRQLSQN